jgi:hypothetical protein
MTQAEFLEVFKEWSTSDAYRRAFEQDPVAALRQKGIVLSMEEETALRAAPWKSNLSAQELQERVSKAIGIKLTAFL